MTRSVGTVGDAADEVGRRLQLCHLQLLLLTTGLFCCLMTADSLCGFESNFAVAINGSCLEMQVKRLAADTCRHKSAVGQVQQVHWWVKIRDRGELKLLLCLHA